MALTLGSMIQSLDGVSLQGDPDLVITEVTTDSRQAGPGSLFIAVRGTAGDGHDYLDKVAAAGCQAVAVEESVAQPFRAVAVCTSTRPLGALLARQLNGFPDLDLLTVGVTGTNGKTTVSYLMRQMLAQLQGPCGLLGTVSYDDGKDSIPAPLTTPGGPEFFRWLGRMRDQGCGSAAMEISSHALDQERTAGLGLDAAVMTNLGRDHLDYHADMQEYFQAKARILDLLRPDGQGPRGRAGVLVINADDPYLAGLADVAGRAVLFSAQADSPVKADLQLVASDLGLDGTSLQFRWREQDLNITSPLVGRYNVENLAASLAAGLALGFPATACCGALAEVRQVPGRLERFSLPGGGIAVVDYAHTHDALRAVLEACDELSSERLLVVFGCGGDRDQGKRSLMGEVAARHSDLTWITSDNPRSEDPLSICQQIEAGYSAVENPRSQSCQVLVDRTEAIEAALGQANQGDIVVVAGKGHEDYQIVGSQRLDLDDRRIVRDWAERGGHGM